MSLFRCDAQEKCDAIQQTALGSLTPAEGCALQRLLKTLGD